MKTRIVAFEGIECSGKTTSISNIYRKLEDFGYKVYFSSKNDSEIDIFIKAALSFDDVCPKEKVLLMFTRYLEKERILAVNLSKFDFILLDRFDISVLVYAEMLNLLPEVMILFDNFSNHLKPDFYLFYSISFEQFILRGGLQRTTTENQVIDEKWFQKKSNIFLKYYNMILKNKRMMDCNISTEEVVKFLCLDMC